MTPITGAFPVPALLVIGLLLVAIGLLLRSAWRREARAERWCEELGHDVGRFVDGEFQCMRCGEPIK